jgi:hypothetical protein
MTHTAVWLTPHRLHFQTNGRSKQIIAFGPHDHVAPEDRLDDADLLIAHNGFRRTTPWVFCPVKNDGMVADIVELDVPKLCDHSLIWFREDQWECRLCLGHADTYSDLMNMIVTETS